MCEVSYLENDRTRAEAVSSTRVGRVVVVVVVVDLEWVEPVGKG